MTLHSSELCLFYTKYVVWDLSWTAFLLFTCICISTIYGYLSILLFPFPLCFIYSGDQSNMDYMFAAIYWIRINPLTLVIPIMQAFSWNQTPNNELNRLVGLFPSSHDIPKPISSQANLIPTQSHPNPPLNIQRRRWPTLLSNSQPLPSDIIKPRPAGR